MITYEDVDVSVSGWLSRIRGCLLFTLTNTQPILQLHMNIFFSFLYNVRKLIVLHIHLKYEVCISHRSEDTDIQTPKTMIL